MHIFEILDDNLCDQCKHSLTGILSHPQGKR